MTWSSTNPEGKCENVKLQNAHTQAHTHTCKEPKQNPEYPQRTYVRNITPGVCYDKLPVHTLMSEKLRFLVI